MRGVSLACVVLASCTYSFDRSILDAGPDGAGDDGGVAGPCDVPLAGRTTDPAPAAPPRPMRGERIFDPMFGTCVTRISDAADDAMAVSEPRVDPFDGEHHFSPDGAVAIFSTGFYRYYSFDAIAPRRAVPMLAFFNEVLGFYANDPTEILLVETERTLTRYDVDSRRFSDLSTFTLPSELMGADDFRPTRRSLSADGTRALVIAHGTGRTLSIDTASGEVLGTSSQTAGGAMVSPSGRWMIELEDDRARVRDPRFTEERVFMGSGRSIAAVDVVVLPNGNDGLAVVDGIRLWVFDLDGTTDPIMNLPLVDESVLGDLDFSVSLDGSAFDRPGWLVISFGPCRDGELCAADDAWARDKISLVGIGDPPVIHDLVWHNSTGRPRAMASRDLRRIVFMSTWNDAGDEEIYVVDVPATALALP
jgi:hypothetical protein